MVGINKLFPDKNIIMFKSTKYYILFALITILFSACTHQKKREFQKIELDNSCLSNLNLSFFQEMYPGIEIGKVYHKLGVPDERFVIKEIDQSEQSYLKYDSVIDLAYYSNQGRLLLHWSGHNIDEIGMIEFRPKIKLPINRFYNKNISVHKEILRFDCDGVYKVYVYLKYDLESIKRIEWWFK